MLVSEELACAGVHGTTLVHLLCSTVQLTSDELHILGADGRMEFWIVGTHQGLIKRDEPHVLFHRQTDRQTQSRDEDACNMHTTAAQTPCITLLPMLIRLGQNLPHP